MTLKAKTVVFKISAVVLALLPMTSALKQGGLPAEIEARLAADAELQRQIDSIPAGPEGPPGPPGISSAFCSVTVGNSGADYKTVQAAADALNGLNSPCTILQPDDPHEATIQINDAKGIRISGLTVAGPGSVGIHTDSSAVEISNTVLTGFYAGSVLPFPAATYAENSIVNINCSDVDSNAVAIFAVNSRGTLRNSYFTDNGGEGTGSTLPAVQGLS